MSDNGSGVAQINSAGQPVVGGTDITDTALNALTADLAVMLTNRICKDGQTTITANIPFNDKKITGLAAGTARTDAASLATIMDGTGVYVATVGGTANAITLTPSPAIAAYAAGQEFEFFATATNTAAVTVAVSGLAAKSIKDAIGGALTAGEIRNLMIIRIRYNGTNFILASVMASAAAWTPVLTCDTPGDLSVAYSTQVAYMSRAARSVTLGWKIVTSTFTHTTASGSISISGVPFAAMGSPVSLWYGTGELLGENTTGQRLLAPSIGYTGASQIAYVLNNDTTNGVLNITDHTSGVSMTLSGTITYIAA